MEFARTVRWLKGDAHEGSLSSLQPELHAEVVAMLRGGQHTEAVALVSERTGITVGRARRLVDAAELQTS